MKVKELLIEAEKKEEKTKIENVKVKIKRILCNLLNISKEQIFFHEEDEVTAEIESLFFKQIKELKAGVPIQYIIHKQEFMKLNFYVEDGVLIPQPDTEILVEEAIKKVIEKEKIKILDLCTGTGCIGISLAYYLQKSQVTLSDISEIAIKVAAKNSKKNQVEKRVNIVKSDLFKKIKEIDFDLIVSNPPYIQTRVISTLNIEVQKEPILALDGGKDGLDFYRSILRQAWRYLKKDGYLLLEIGFDQKEQVEQLVKDNTNYQLLETKKDLAGNDRIIIIKRR